MAQTIVFDLSRSVVIVLYCLRMRSGVTEWHWRAMLTELTVGRLRFLRRTAGGLVQMGQKEKQNRDVRAHEPGEADESVLVTHLRAGDEEAFRVLISKYYGSLLRFAMTFVSERSAAEEVVQETWLGVFRGLPGFEGRSSLKTWMFRILANQAKTRGKREARWIPFSSLKDPQSESDYEPAVDPSRFNAGGMWAEPPPSWTNAPPEELLLRGETMELIQRAIAELPPNQRVVVTLHDVEGVEPNEICNILEISETNHRVLLHRGRSRLRSALEQHLSKK
jgi:RNA polymerase sigma-70 factor, ECF subfamily